MRRVVLVMCLSVAALGGCVSHRPAAADEPYTCESTHRPKWVQYDWWDEHPVLKGTLIAAGGAAVLSLYVVGGACWAIRGGG